MKNLINFTLGVIVGLFISFLIIGCFDLDGVNGFIGKTFIADQTVTTTGFSEYAFGKIRKGMSEKEVLDLIGEPLSWSDEIKDDKRIGYWTNACCSGNFRGRVVFFLNGKVSEIFAEYYWD